MLASMQTNTSSNFYMASPQRPPLSFSPSSEFEFEFKAEAASAAAPIADGLPLPQPLDSLHQPPIPPFLSKTYDIVDHPSLDAIISWGPNGNTFVVWNPLEFASLVLPRNFKHNNFSSFVRQLNTYGFRKIGTDKWEFANEGFVKGQKHLLRNIHRRRSQHNAQQTGNSTETRKAAMEGEIKLLRNERSSMMQKLVQLQDEQRGADQHMEAMKEKLKTTEKRQKQMVSFLIKVMQKPTFLKYMERAREQRSIDTARNKCAKLQLDVPATSPEGEFMALQPEPSNLAALVRAECTPSHVEDGETAVIHQPQVEDGEMAVLHQPQFLDECCSLFPGNLVSDFPELSMSGDNSMTMEEVWDTRFKTCADIYSPWDNLGNSNMQGIANSSGMDIWGIDSQQSASNLGFESWLDEDE